MPVEPIRKLVGSPKVKSSAWEAATIVKIPQSAYSCSRLPRVQIHYNSVQPRFPRIVTRWKKGGNQNLAVALAPAFEIVTRWKKGGNQNR